MKSINDIANDIDKYVILSAHLELTCKYLSIGVVASLMYNFRDALTHYVRLYEAGTSEDEVSQKASIDEHLSRGLKDTCFSIIDEMINRILDAFKNTTKIQETCFRKQLHVFKEMEIKLRKNTKMKDINSFSLFKDELTKSIIDTKNIFQSYNVPFKSNANYQL